MPFPVGPIPPLPVDPIPPMPVDPWAPTDPDPLDPVVPIDPLPVDPDPVPVDPDPLPVDPDPIPVDPDPLPVDPDPIPVDPNPLPVDPEPVTPGPAPHDPDDPVLAPKLGTKYWSVTGDPIVKTLGGKAETLNNAGGRYTLMATQDGDYAVTHEIVEDPGTAATRRDRHNGAHTQAVAVRQDGDVVVFRNQQARATLGKTVNQLEINGKIYALDELKRRGRIGLPGGGEIRWTAPTKAIKEGTIRVVSALGDVLRIEDKGPWIDLYGTPSGHRKPGDLAGLAGSNDARGPGFYRRLEKGEDGDGWTSVKRVSPDADHDQRADASLLDSWRTRGDEDLLADGPGGPAKT